VLSFILRRLGVIVLTMLCLTLIVFFLVNLDPNLKKLAIAQTEMRATAEQQESWLQRNGYRQNFFIRYGQWLGVWPKQPVVDPATGEAKPVSRSATNPPSRLSPASCKATSAAPPNTRCQWRKSCFRPWPQPAS
jgi:peptide/nickel transport system permease protein